VKVLTERQEESTLAAFKRCAQSHDASQVAEEVYRTDGGDSSTRYQRLMKELNCFDKTAKLGLIHAINLTLITDDILPWQEVLAPLGVAVVRLPESDWKNGDEKEALAVQINRASKFITTVSDSIIDGKVDEDEFREMERKIMGVFEGWVRYKYLHERSKEKGGNGG